MIWSSMKFVPQKYHNFVIIRSENILKLVINSEGEIPQKWLNIKANGIYY